MTNSPFTHNQIDHNYSRHMVFVCSFRDKNSIVNLHLPLHKNSILNVNEQQICFARQTILYALDLYHRLQWSANHAKYSQIDTTIIKSKL